jgi:choline dehydrogenase-like flavoprotein
VRVVLPSSQLNINALSTDSFAYTRGTSEDYDRIANLTGDSGWSWDALWPYILKAELSTPPAVRGAYLRVFNIHSEVSPCLL